MGDDLDLDKSIVSKEAYKDALNLMCEKILRFLYVCSYCNLRYYCFNKKYLFHVKNTGFANYMPIALYVIH